MSDAPDVPRSALREAIQAEYDVVAREPDRGFHFHTGRRLARILGYDESWLSGVPEGSIESFAGTGNPFSMGEARAGEHVVDIGCGAGIDTMIAANMVGTSGAVVGIDMTPSMLQKARTSAEAAGMIQVRVEDGYAEQLPVPDGWADLIISNGVFNLFPDKPAALAEMRRVLKPGGRMQIGDILVQKEVPDSAKERIDLWTG